MSSCATRPAGAWSRGDWPSPPTTARRISPARVPGDLHSTAIQPFVGYIWSRDRFYLHGFTAIDTPASLQIATMVYNDVGVGYFVLRRSDPFDRLTAIAPTFEVHVNTPLTHGDWQTQRPRGRALRH